MKKINIKELGKSLMTLPARFPEAMCFLALLMIWYIMDAWDLIDFVGRNWNRHEDGWIHVTDIQYGTILYYLTIGFLLSTVLHVWGEEIRNKRNFHIASIMAHLLLLFDAIYLWTLSEGSFNTELYLAHGSFCTALIIGGIFLPFFREKNDVASWNFAVRMFLYAILCYISCAIVYGALALLIHSLDMLFGIHVNVSWFGTFAAILIVGTAPSLWLSRIPQGEAKFNREAVSFKFLIGLIRYLFLPIIAIYLVVLYVYGLKILLAMELPKGGVCYLIHVLMAGCIGIEILLYPHIQAGAKPFEKKLVRWLPVLIMPQLVLMTVAIGRRFCDYGVTLNRLYTIALNIWYYGVCIGLWLTRCRRINWISLSFAAIYLLTSALPVNFCTISRNTIMHRVEEFFACHPAAYLPLQKNDYDKYMASIPCDEAESLRGDLNYIKNLYSWESISQYVDSDVPLYKTFKVAEDKEPSGPNLQFTHDGKVVIPGGYTSFHNLDIKTKCNAKDSTVWHLMGEDSLRFTIDIEALKSMDLDNVKSLSFPEDNRRGLWVIKFVNICPHWNDPFISSVSINGYFFEEALCSE
ncbi:MAG: DUF4153 domain-containing protein [Bacteroidales bacterium]|nr:DUF4153 domain-containing protein [Candidatus Liminaster caballi]